MTGEHGVNLLAPRGHRTALYENGVHGAAAFLAVVVVRDRQGRYLCETLGITIRRKYNASPYQLDRVRKVGEWVLL